MELRNPFEAPGQWRKANLHTHSTTSDGDVSAAERVQQYRSQGYNVLAITDHRATNDLDGLEADGFLPISGIELHPACPGGGDPYHLVGLDVPHGFSVDPESDAATHIARVKDAGGEVIIAHPYWCGHSLKHLLPLEGCIGIELFNATCSKIGKAYSSVHWDDLLGEGRIIGGTACDDTHRGRDIFMGWTMLKCEALTTQSVMDTLRAGCCYASCGPTIVDFRMVDGTVTLKCSPAREVHFMCRRSTGLSFYADEGAPIESAEFKPNPASRHVRAEVIDDKGRHAWTNPILLKQQDE